VILPNAAFQVARITDVSHWHLTCIIFVIQVYIIYVMYAMLNNVKSKAEWQAGRKGRGKRKNKCY
jgi:hypothetical protein